MTVVVRHDVDGYRKRSEEFRAPKMEQSGVAHILMDAHVSEMWCGEVWGSWRRAEALELFPATSVPYHRLPQQTSACTMELVSVHVSLFCAVRLSAIDPEIRPQSTP
jgi:hypothetical protein